MNTLFCLVSRQAMANVLPVLMYKPKNVVLFTTLEEKKSADNLEKLFKSKDFNVLRKDNLNAYNYVAFKDVVKNELSKFQEDVWLNVTGGTKLMALAAYEAFVEKDRNIIYCNTENNEIIYLFPELKTEQLKLNLSIEDYLNAYGYELLEIKSHDVKEEYFELFAYLYQNNLIQKFTVFLDNFRSQSAVDSNLKTFNDKKDKIFSIQKTVSAVLLFIKDKKYKFTDDRFLKGEWLEYFIQWSLKKQNITPDVGVKIKSSSDVENEIDIMFIKNYQLNLISCKSGRRNDPNRDIYEIETLRNIAGGTFGKAFLVTAAPLTEPILKRAEDLKIKTFTVESIHIPEFQ
ncbi:DUF1887 family CARF protein [Ignavibacterium sp.]|uniref:Card1-like endonuclease domain-containing protein n=1 Tax=Ignavibacterium sp. TaxID=2651167 RepID=UPI00307CF96F